MTDMNKFTAEDHTIISFAGDIANSPSAFSKSNRFDKAKNTTFFNSPDKSLYYRIPFSNSMDDDSTSGSHDKSRLPEGTVDLASRVSLEDVQPEPYRPSIEPSIYYGAPHTPLQPESPVSSLGWDQEGRLQQDQINKKKNNSCKYDKCCIFWLKGVCMYGPNCFYRHSTTELEASQPAGLRSPTVTKEEAKYDSVNRAADPIVTLLDMINNANTNWLRGLRFQECLLKDRSDQSLPDSPSGNSSRENSDGLRPEHFSSVMIEAITRHRGAFRERGAAGCPFASIEECLEVVGLDCSMASQTDTDSAIRSSSSSFSPESDGSSLPLSVPLPYPATIMSMPMQPFQYAAVPTSAPLAFQDMDQRQCQYQYQQRLASQWNYMMYYVPLSPQGQTKTASGATGELTGESKIIEGVAHSMWAMQDWRSTFIKTEVLVMTPEICKHFMYHNYFDVSDINCVIIDECHHAFGNDPLVSICSRIKAHSKTKPLILAMTASLIPSKKGEAKSVIAQLEANLYCKLLCYPDVLEDYRKLVPIPNCSLYRYTADTSNFVDSDVTTEEYDPSAGPVQSNPGALLMFALLRVRHSQHILYIRKFV
eukprot:gene19083-19441_t